MVEEDETNTRRAASEVADEEFSEFTKKPVTIEAVKMDEPFVVETMENKRGEKLYGDEGDYLIRGVEGELYPCDASVFDQTYVEADSGDVPKYSENDLREARCEFRNNTLDHVGFGITDTDARAGVRGFLSILRDS